MKQDYEACFGESEAIADPIYGMIEISAFEKRLLACREMQRLRHIRQLGLAHLVYPAAEHSRFTHSLGVCHQAKSLINRINANMMREARYRAWRAQGCFRQTAELVPSHPITHVEKVVIAAAGLIHDVPHVAFSHDMEGTAGDTLGIPSHDDFAANPALFHYLFDTKNSELAQVIDVFNRVFWAEGLLNPQHAETYMWDAGECRFNERTTWGNAITTRWPDLVTEDGMIPLNGKGPLDGSLEHLGLQELPILGVMIFEVHAIEKEDQWLRVEKDKRTKRAKHWRDISSNEAADIRTDWDDTSKTVKWMPLYGWFRPYRKEIIGNTICADLIDYVQRDGHNTGVISHVDLKFLDRMAITKAVKDDGPSAGGWRAIPDTCEHIVFDIYDHKRGFLRQSVITEILACLQGRYLLCERVYQHRVVEGARAMLQCISRLLCEASVLSLKRLHVSAENHGADILGDDAFLVWVCGLDESTVGADKREAIAKAKELAALLLQRRVYREAVIIDGIHGTSASGMMGGPEKNCEALAEALIPHTETGRRANDAFLESLGAELRKHWKNFGRNEMMTPRLPALIGIREFGRRYKIPVVLVAKPYRYPEKGAPLEISPLFACKDPSHIKDQLEAMKSAYDSLWRVFLFLHPGYHKLGDAEEKAHNASERLFLNHVRNATRLHWANSIEFGQLLPAESIDIKCFLRDQQQGDAVESLVNVAEPYVSIVAEARFPQAANQGAHQAFRVGCMNQLRTILSFDAGQRRVVLRLRDTPSALPRFQANWKVEEKAARNDAAESVNQKWEVERLLKQAKEIVESML